MFDVNIYIKVLLSAKLAVNNMSSVKLVVKNLFDVNLAVNNMFDVNIYTSKYSETCVQQPPLGPPKSGRCSEGDCCSEVGPKYKVKW